MITRPMLVLAPAMLSSLLMAGCGGGGGNDAAEQTQTSARSVSPASVQLEGCVVNSQWTGASETAVHVRTEDGRTVATVFTNARGVFFATVPARADIVVNTVLAGPGGLALKTGSASLSLGACLLTDL